jgi:hypothetical protein
MGASQEYRQRVMKQLVPIGTIRSCGLFREARPHGDHLLFGVAGDDAVYPKVDNSNRLAHRVEQAVAVPAQFQKQP